MPSQSSPNTRLGKQALDQQHLQLRAESSGRLIISIIRPYESFKTGLLPCFDPGCDETDVVHPCLMAIVDDLGDLAEVEILVTFNKHDLFLTRRKDLRQLR